MYGADNSKLGSHNGGLAYRKSAVFEDVVGHDRYLTYGERIQGIDVGNNFVKCNVHARPGVPDPHFAQSPSNKQVGAVGTPFFTPRRRHEEGNSPRSSSKTANPLKSLACFHEKPRNSDKVEAAADITPTTPPRKWRTLKSHGSI